MAGNVKHNSVIESGLNKELSTITDERMEEILSKVRTGKALSFKDMKELDAAGIDPDQFVEEHKNDLSSAEGDISTSPITTGAAQDTGNKSGLKAVQEQTDEEKKASGHEDIEFKTFENVIGKDNAEKFKKKLSACRERKLSFQDTLLECLPDIKDLKGQGVLEPDDKIQDKTRFVVEQLEKIYDKNIKNTKSVDQLARDQIEHAQQQRDKRAEKNVADVDNAVANLDNPDYVAKGNYNASDKSLKNKAPTEFNKTLSADSPAKQELAQKIKNALNNPDAVAKLGNDKINALIAKYADATNSTDDILDFVKAHPLKNIRVIPDMNTLKKGMLNVVLVPHDGQEKALYLKKGTDLDAFWEAMKAVKDTNLKKRQAMQEYNNWRKDNDKDYKSGVYKEEDIPLLPPLDFVESNLSGKPAEFAARVNKWLETGDKSYLYNQNDSTMQFDPETGLFTEQKLNEVPKRKSGYSKSADYYDLLANALNSDYMTPEEFNDVMTHHAKPGNMLGETLDRIFRQKGASTRDKALQLITDLKDFNDWMTNGKKGKDMFFFGDALSAPFLRKFANQLKSLRGVSGDDPLSLQLEEELNGPAKEKHTSDVTDLDLTHLKQQIKEEQDKENPDTNLINKLTAELNAKAADRAIAASKNTEDSNNATSKGESPIIALRDLLDPMSSKRELLSGLFGYDIPASYPEEYLKPLITGTSKLNKYDLERSKKLNNMVDPATVRKFLKPNIDSIYKNIKEGTFDKIGEGFDESSATNLVHMLEDALALTYNKDEQADAIKREAAGQHSAASLADLNSIAQDNPKEFALAKSKLDALRSELKNAIVANGNKADTPEIELIREELNKLVNNVTRMQTEKSDIRKLADAKYNGNYHDAELAYLSPDISTGNGLEDFLTEYGAKSEYMDRLKQYYDKENKGKWPAVANALRQAAASYPDALSGLNDMIDTVSNWRGGPTSKQLLQSQSDSFDTLGLSPEEFSALRNLDVETDLKRKSQKVKGNATINNGPGSEYNRKQTDVAKKIQDADYTDTTRLLIEALSNRGV